MQKTEHPVINGDFAEIQRPITVAKMSVISLLVSALEGGSNYWYCNAHYDLPKGIEFGDFRPGGKFSPEDSEYFHPLQIIPFVEGCALTIEDTEAVDDDGEPKKYRVDVYALKRGLEIMSKKYPSHFQDFITENDDSETGDVFLQCCVFGELIYG